MTNTSLVHVSEADWPIVQEFLNQCAMAVEHNGKAIVVAPTVKPHLPKELQESDAVQFTWDEAQVSLMIPEVDDIKDCADEYFC